MYYSARGWTRHPIQLACMQPQASQPFSGYGVIGLCWNSFKVSFVGSISNRTLLSSSFLVQTAERRPLAFGPMNQKDENGMSSNAGRSMLSVVHLPYWSGPLAERTHGT